MALKDSRTWMLFCRALPLFVRFSEFELRTTSCQTKCDWNWFLRMLFLWGKVDPSHRPSTCSRSLRLHKILIIIQFQYNQLQVFQFNDSKFTQRTSKMSSKCKILLCTMWLSHILSVFLSALCWVCRAVHFPRRRSGRRLALQVSRWDVMSIFALRCAQLPPCRSELSCWVFGEAE